MNQDVRKKRLTFIHDGKNYNNNQKLLDEFKASHPEVDINNIENVQCDEDDILNQTMILKIQTARDSINGFEDKLDRVEKKYGKKARKAFKENYVDEESNKELEKEINKSPHLSQLPEARRMKGENEKEKPDPISEETQKKQTRNRKRLRKTASLLGKDSENGVEIGAGCADRSTQQRENRYSLRSILETLDFDTYKNSLFEYDDTGEKDETGPDTDNEKAAAQQSTTHSSLTVKRHTKPFGESSKEAADAQTQKRAETKKKGEGGTKANSKDTNADIEEEEEKEKEEEEPAPKRVKRGGGLPIFRGLHFFLTRLPQEIGCAVRKVIPRDNIFSTAAAAFEYVTCCNKRKRFKAPETFLIATQPIRTAKYIMALALGVPCVSHEWILQSVEANRLCDYRDFLLPRGFSVLEKTLVTAKHILNEARPLDGVRVELLFQVNLYQNDICQI